LNRFFLVNFEYGQNLPKREVVMKKANTGRLGCLLWKVEKGSLQKGMAGFTLIELLVVVLIIGILASVAMPQYNKAVEKSRATQALAILKSLYAAQETYYMANSSYATSFNELDINVPLTGATKWFTLGHDTRANENWSLQIYNDGMGNCAIYLGRISGEYKGTGFTIGLSGNNGQDNGVLFCGERKSIGISYEKEAGSYCVQIFGGTKVFEDPGLRRYRLP
jgi:prepilin-type N-terminal cleavage/methylation domain-containing protein